MTLIGVMGKSSDPLAFSPMKPESDKTDTCQWQPVKLEVSGRAELWNFQGT